jgi:hypothetical protein
MNAKTEELRRLALLQSLESLNRAVEDLEGITNRMQKSRELHPHGMRLREIQQRFREELDRMVFVMDQGHAPKTAEELALGRQVQQALTEIVQI